MNAALSETLNPPQCKINNVNIEGVIHKELMEIENHVFLIN